MNDRSKNRFTINAVAGRFIAQMYNKLCKYTRIQYGKYKKINKLKFIHKNHASAPEDMINTKLPIVCSQNELTDNLCLVRAQIHLHNVRTHTLSVIYESR